MTKQVTIVKQCNNKKECHGDEHGHAVALDSDEVDSVDGNNDKEKVKKEFEKAQFQLKR